MAMSDYPTDAVLLIADNSDCLVNNSGQFNEATQEMSENYEVKLHQFLVIQLLWTTKYVL